MQICSPFYDLPGGVTVYGDGLFERTYLLRCKFARLVCKKVNHIRSKRMPDDDEFFVHKFHHTAAAATAHTNLCPVMERESVLERTHKSHKRGQRVCALLFKQLWSP